MDRYLYIKSNDSDSYFSDNQVYRFKVHLNVPLPLHGMWKVALTEFYAEEKAKPKSKTNSIYIYTDICKESIVHGKEQPLLRRLEKTTQTGWDYMLDTLYYLPIVKTEVREFQIFIKGEDGSFASDLKEPLHLTLHFKPYPFY